MAPSGSGGAQKLTPLESKLHKLGLEFPNSTATQDDLLAKAGVSVTTATQDAINLLLRKNLISMFKNNKNEVSFRFATRDEAKNMGAMDPDEKLVFDQIKNGGNQGIWSRNIKTNTGLHISIINRVLKVLEGRKSVKVVKSVKAPTRKIYMLASLTPSVELTGGPWFTDNELDSEFVEALRDCATNLLKAKSVPSDPGDVGGRLYLTSSTRHLPTVQDIGAYFKKIEVASVELMDEHVEALLDLMVADGTVEKILRSSEEEEGSGLSAKKRARDDDSEEDDSDVPRQKKRVKKIGNSDSSDGNSSDSDDALGNADADQSDSDFNSDEDAEAAKSRGKKSKKSKKKKKDRTKKVVVENDDGEDSMSSGNEEEVAKRQKKKDKKLLKMRQAAGEIIEPPSIYVYRLIKPYTPRIGWRDMPCGVCPSEAFCAEPVRPLGAHHGRKPTATRGSTLLGQPRTSIAFEGSMQGVGMLGGQGAAIGTSSEKWGDMSGGLVGGNVAPVNPRDCSYFKDWLDF